MRQPNEGEEMKLYDVPRGVKILIPDGIGLGVPDNTELFFHHIDGMYSYCTDENGDVVHIPAWAEVNIKGGW